MGAGARGVRGWSLNLLQSATLREGRETGYLLGMNSVMEAEWRAAIEDAALAFETLRLFEMPGQMGPSGLCAVYVGQPGAQYNPEEESVLNALAPIEAELAAAEEFHRVVVWRNNTAPVLAALLRHELEHVRQWERHGDGVFRLNRAHWPALFEKGGTRGYKRLLNMAPLEVDASAAAARFVWRRHGNGLSIDAIPPVHQPLFAFSGGPEPIDTLPERTIHFAYLYAERCERLATAENLVFSEVLEQRWRGGAELWSRLRGDVGD